MKRYKNILVVLSVVMLTGLLSCQLVEDIDDFEPLYSLEGGKAIVDEASAENALNGIYAKTKNLEYGILSRELLSGNLLVGLNSKNENRRQKLPNKIFRFLD